MIAVNSIRVGRMRVAGAAHSNIETVLSGQLAAAELTPDGLPPSAVLIVKALKDPLPRTVRISASECLVPATWEQSVRHRLDALRRIAARPRQGSIPADADAVLFVDLAELLACLVIDLARGEARGHWWWRQVLPQLPALSGSLSSVAGALGTEPAMLPAMLQHLADWGESDRALSSVSSREAETLLLSMLEEGGAAELAALLQENRDGAGSGPDAAQGEEQASAERTAPGAEPPSSPWNRRGSGVEAVTGLSGLDQGSPFPAHSAGSPDWLEDSAWRGFQAATSICRRLPKAHRGLLGLGLVLAGHRDALASRTFRERVVSWWRGGAASIAAPSALHEVPSVSQPPRTSADSASAEVPTPPIPSSASAIDLQRAAPRRVGVERPEPMAVTRADDAPERTDLPSREAARQAPDISKGSPGASLDTEAQAIPDPGDGRDVGTGGAVGGGFLADGADAGDGMPERLAKPLPGQAPASDSAPAEATAAEQPFAPTEEAVPTRIGGVLYLINLMVALDLPACLADREGASPIGPWALLELLGRVFLGERDQGLADDPLWGLLAGLDGRPPGQPPLGELGEGDYRLPDAWVGEVQVPGEDFRWSVLGQCLIVWSEAGYCVLDVQRGRRGAGEQARRELSVLLGEDAPLRRAGPDGAPLADLTGIAGLGIGIGLRRWLGLATPFLRRRLALAMPEGAELVKDALLCPARLFVTSTHIDLVADLDAVSLPARIAGLDRDPGWVPELGRVVLFHFR